MNKDKIIRIDGNFDFLLENHNILKQGGVIWINELPIADNANELFKVSKCETCNSSNIKGIAYEAHKNNGAFYFRCLDCLSQNWLFISTEKITSANIIIVYGSYKKKIYKDQIENLNCPLCKSDTHADLETKYFKDELPLIYPMKIICTNDNCQFASNYIFWNCPYSFFEHAIGLAKLVVEKSGEASVVLAVAALETYFEKAFYFSNSKNKYLAQERKINFQNIKDVKKSYQNLMNIELPSLIGNHIWENICNAIKKRHRIVHCGGFDEYYEQIEITESDAKNIIYDIEGLIKILDKKIFDECLI
ncbi:MAG: hypothetical protein ACXWT3_02470 [Methylococcaceae bacterium]